MERNINPHNSLPPEIWCNIIRFVDQITDLIAIRRICKSFSNLVQEENISNFFGYELNKSKSILPTWRQISLLIISIYLTINLQI